MAGNDTSVQDAEDKPDVLDLSLGGDSNIKGLDSAKESPSGG